LEQDNLFRTACDNGGGNWPGPGGLQTKPLRAFMCPVDLTNAGGLASTQTDTAGVSYAANYLLFAYGEVPDPWDTSHTQMPRYTIGNIPGGASNTVMLAEHSAVSLDDDVPKVMVYGPDSGGLPAGTVLPLFNYAGHDAALPMWDRDSE